MAISKCKQIAFTNSKEHFVVDFKKKAVGWTPSTPKFSTPCGWDRNQWEGVISNPDTD